MAGLIHLLKPFPDLRIYVLSRSRAQVDLCKLRDLRLYK